jgi:lysophospholipase L1-like esterase
MLSRAAALILLVLVTACGGSQRLPRLEAGAVVLAFGDSLTLGVGARPEESYPAVLERAIGRKVVNAGVSGETSSQGLTRLPDVLDETHPALVILCHGGNDFLQRLDPAGTASNVRAMVELAKAHGASVLLVATPRPGLPPSVPAFYAEVAKAAHVPLEDAVIRTIEFDNSLKSDSVHPNAEGYARMARAIGERLHKAGAL